LSWESITLTITPNQGNTVNSWQRGYDEPMNDIDPFSVSDVKREWNRMRDESPKAHLVGSLAISA